MSLPLSNSGIWRRLSLPEFDQAVAEREGMFAGHQPRLRSPTVHLGFFEGERKQGSRGWDEDTSTAARNIFAIIAIAMLLLGAWVVIDATDAPAPVIPQIMLAQEVAQ